MLTEAQIERYHRDGFVYPIDGFAAEEARRYRRAMEEFDAAQGRELTKGHNFKPRLLFTWVDEIVHASGPVSPPSAYHFSFHDFDQFDGTRVVIERWPKTKGIYSAQFSGDPVQYVHVGGGDPLWNLRFLTGPCDIISNETL